MSWKEVFTDENHIFSWRKSLTGIAAALFITACIVYWFGGRALPQEYMIIISGVFAFYFFKERMSGNSSRYNPYSPDYSGNQYRGGGQYQQRPYGQDRNPYGNYQPPPQYPQDSNSGNSNGGNGNKGDDGST